MNHIKINFDILNELLEEAKKIHHDFNEIRKKVDIIANDFNNLIIFMVTRK